MVCNELAVTGSEDLRSSKGDARPHSVAQKRSYRSATSMVVADWTTVENRRRVKFPEAVSVAGAASDPRGASKVSTEGASEVSTPRRARRGSRVSRHIFPVFGRVAVETMAIGAVAITGDTVGDAVGDASA
mmetsp:Transcript_73669/g.159409  ORF Transcript_73669/g.159409 Transcript_73669/m.159409 type:complete len:131 (-) Transcript_73669:592-984(-)|eukprot:CAMPEP_0170571082 /NCGR_PEP_ID=MMETSP0224-20130122/1468_1 /TAXON_ID=285029 /ORGANISM="Togula jolla, Strain CCCM 725" /LENGTH=130 /DNA_ID=CAMNT_0010893431 /DNA_START=156 /DNA_END=548 /DNA_ORIENTATION=+